MDGARIDAVIRPGSTGQSARSNDGI